MMNASELRKLSEEKLLEELDEAREELMRFRFQQATGELSDFNRIRSTRRLIARIQTILHERQQQEA